jgi:hypothetical protein
MSILKTHKELNSHLCIIKEPYLESDMQALSTLVVRYKNRAFTGVFFTDKRFNSVEVQRNLVEQSEKQVCVRTHVHSFVGSSSLGRIY